MKKPNSTADTKPKSLVTSENIKPAEQQADAFQPRKEDKPNRNTTEAPHFLDVEKGLICDTGPRGKALPQGDSPFELVINVTEGFIPLWAPNTVLRWRFRERSFAHFQKPEAAKNEIRTLLGKALIAWGPAVPVKFSESNDAWDFEIVMRANDDCNVNGCTLASAFFPDSGRHELEFYPIMFRQPINEQVDTLCHEIGHIFGLRHFFANVSETAFPSEIFGEHNKFSIMNYGELSTLTKADRDDLARLYQQAWSGILTEINGTPIQFVRPYHTLLTASDSVFAVNENRTLHRIKSFEEFTRSVR